MKKKDLIIIGLGTLLLLGGWIIYFASLNRGPKVIVEITYLNELYYREELTEDLVYDEIIEGPYGFENHIMIKDGEVWMESANCSDQKCVQMGHINEDSLLGIIVCAPHGVSIRIINEGNSLDN